MNQEAVNQLFRFLIENAQSSSPWLSPEIEWTIELKSLLDTIADIRGISQEDNGREYNALAEEISKQRNIKD